jgi:hypothetical protein
VIVTSDAPKAATTEKAVPPWRWQSVQWQTPWNMGSAVAVYRTLPQRHPPVI